jgi:hypothetical protein
MDRYEVLIDNLKVFTNVFKTDDGINIDPMIVSCSHLSELHDSGIVYNTRPELLTKFNFDLLSNILPKFLFELNETKDKWIENKIKNNQPLNKYINGPYRLDKMKLEYFSPLKDLNWEQLTKFNLFLDFLDLKPCKIDTKMINGKIIKTTGRSYLEEGIELFMNRKN